jgi:alpha/beta hydrolase fold
MRDRPFPSRRASRTLWRMQGAGHVAGLSLRGSTGPLRAQVSWPGSLPGDRPPLAVLVDGAEVPPAFAAAGIVVLSVRAAAFHDAVATVEWAADHAAELGADARRLIVAGGALAAAVALHARDAAWPPLARQILIDGDLALPLRAATVDGVAPATIVTGGRASARRYAARLRHAGVEVEELRDTADLVPSLRRVQHRLGAGADLIDPPVAIPGTVSGREAGREAHTGCRRRARHAAGGRGC